MATICMPNTLTSRFKMLLPCVKNKHAKGPTQHNIIKQCVFVHVGPDNITRGGYKIF